MVGIAKEIFVSNWLIYECCWGGYKKRSYNKNGVMENKGRGHGIPRRPQGVGHVNELVVMVREMIDRMNSMEES